MRIVQFSIVAGVMIGLMGCTGSTDPETASLFDNINNLQSGEYDRQIAQNEADAAAILANNRAAEQRIAGLESQRGVNARTIGELKSRVASARNSAAQARANAGGDTVKLQRISALEGQITAVEAEINAGSADPRSASSELSRIRSALNAI
ncbi:MAG: hypothetical protein AAFQ32_00655 [Pseudomonadota bacterium]